MRTREFGDLEAAVMDRIWRQGRPLLVRDVLDDLNTDRALAYTTVLTVMDKLHRKGWLTRRPQGRAHLYEAVASRESYTAGLMRDAWATSDNQAVVFVHFLEQLSAEETRAVRAALAMRTPDGADVPEPPESAESPESREPSEPSASSEVSASSESSESLDTRPIRP